MLIPKPRRYTPNSGFMAGFRRKGDYRRDRETGILSDFSGVTSTCTPGYRPLSAPADYVDKWPANIFPGTESSLARRSNERSILAAWNRNSRRLIDGKGPSFAFVFPPSFGCFVFTLELDRGNDREKAA